MQWIRFVHGTIPPLSHPYFGHISCAEKCVESRRINLGSESAESAMAEVWLGLAITCLYTMVAMELIIAFT